MNWLHTELACSSVTKLSFDRLWKRNKEIKPSGSSWNVEITSWLLLSLPSNSVFSDKDLYTVQKSHPNNKAILAANLKYNKENFIKINAMMDNSILLTYNVPFYKEDKIYEDQLNIFDNRIIYTKNLAEYQQNDPIFTQQNEINSIRLEKQKLIREIEVLKNG